MGEEWIEVAQGRNQWWFLENGVIQLPLRDIFWLDRGLWGRTVRQRVSSCSP